MLSHLQHVAVAVMSRDPEGKLSPKNALHLSTPLTSETQNEGWCTAAAAGGWSFKCSIDNLQVNTKAPGKNEAFSVFFCVLNLSVRTSQDACVSRNLIFKL